MQGMERLLGLVGIDPEKISAMFASQLDVVKSHYDTFLVAIRQEVQRGSGQEQSHFVYVSDMLDRLDEKLTGIEMSLARIDPAFVSRDFLLENGLPIGHGTDTPATSVVASDDQAEHV